MKVREIIEVCGWVDGSGWSYNATHSDQIIEIDDIPEEMDWGWWTVNDDKIFSVDDVKIVVKYYSEDDEDLENPLGEWNVWESELRY